MPKQNPPLYDTGGAADALGLGGEGDALGQQVSDEEKERRKKLAQLTAGNQSQGAASMGLAAMNLLGQFRA